MPERSGTGIGRAADGKDRFDGETVRRILELAVEEQHRLSNELADAYSLEELEEMAAEAGISSAALRAAIDSHRADLGVPAARSAIASIANPQTGRRARANGMHATRTPAFRRVLLPTAGGVALIGLLFAIPTLGHALLWGTLLALIVLSVLVLLGVSPF